jgi:hypothetical protein
MSILVIEKKNQAANSKFNDLLPGFWAANSKTVCLMKTFLLKKLRMMQ